MNLTDAMLARNTLRYAEDEADAAEVCVVDLMTVMTWARYNGRLLANGKIGPPLGGGASLQTVNAARFSHGLPPFRIARHVTAWHDIPAPTTKEARAFQRPTVAKARSLDWTAELVDQANQMRDDGMTLHQVADRMKCSFDEVCYRLRRARQGYKPSNYMRAWQEDEIAELLRLRAARESYASIAAYLGRSHKSVEQKAAQLRQQART